MASFIARERKLVLALLGLLVLMNVPFGNLVLYPFTLFSTWIHESCHALAALAVGGDVGKLQVFRDGSGLAWTAVPDGRIPRAIVASAGYTGTALAGAAMLAARRSRRAGRAGTTGLGVAVGLTVLLWVRNPFGIASLGLIAAALVLSGLRLPERSSSQLFAFLAATCCLNSFTSIRILFGSNLQVAGRATTGSDARSMAELLWLPAWFWAGLWMVLALVLVAVGLKLGAAQPRAGAPSRRR